MEKYNLITDNLLLLIKEKVKENGIENEIERLHNLIKQINQMKDTMKGVREQYHISWDKHHKATTQIINYLTEIKSFTNL